MKITAIQTSNFLGARAVDVKLSAPVALFAGANGAGKSSLHEAVRMALTGETVRVGLKKELGALVSDGQESGFVEVHTDDGSYSVVLPAGKGMHADLPALPYVLDAQRFARLDPNERRAFLFGLMGLKTDGPAVRERLLSKGCDAAKIEAVAPFLRAGFDAAQKEAQGKARECKAQWKTVTGGETYGSNKAAAWAAAKPTVDAEALAQARADLAVIEEEIEAEAKNIGEIQGRQKLASEQNARMNGLRQQAGIYARIADKLERDRAQLKEVEWKVEKLRGSNLSQGAMPCPCCGVMLVRKDDALVEAAPLAVGTEDDLAALPEYERALTLMRNAVANGERDLAAADAAAKALKAMEDAQQQDETPAADEGLMARIDTLKHSRGNQQAAIRLLEESERRAAEADEKTAKAAALHADVQEWEAIADALAPDGIPGEMLAEALGPINERLIASAEVAEWPRIMIDTDMSILKLDKDRAPRPYAMLSESEKWRTDAMISEAVAHLSGVRLLVLDRFDVLDSRGREDLIYWLETLATGGAIETALIFGTLKALPAGLPETVQAFWIDGGVVVQMANNPETYKRMAREALRA